MAAWFAIGVVLVALALFGVRAFINADPKILARGLKLAAAGLCALLAVILLFRGRIDAAVMLGAAAAFVMGYLPRSLLPFGNLFGGRGLGGGWARAKTGYDASAPGTANSGQQSTVETAWLRMELDHGTGRMDGEVLQGRFAGRRLSGMVFEEIVDLLRDCRVHDNQAAALLEAYLDRSVGEDWRDHAAEAGPAGGPVDATAMTRDQAFEILGLRPGANAAEIRSAHRRLMKKFHPDQGGSTFLAAQINRAKDLLLDGSS